MKTVLTTLNAKYIHTSLALRWLYVANKERFDLSFCEYTIKQDPKKIAEELLATGSDIIGFGVYIWNVTLVKDIISRLKREKPDLIIIVGGPEVTYEPGFFLENWDIDYVISGEGEFVLGELLEAIHSGYSPRIEGVSSKEIVSRTIIKADLNKLTRLPSPYMLEEDISEMGNKMVYFETSRGCPYQCGYCLSSLEKGVRYFPMEYIQRNLKYMIDTHARQIKFLDRTFNLKKDHTYAIFDFLIEHTRKNLSCQFEIYADILDDEVINYLNQKLPPHFFRFEIGIQSTYGPTNEAVKRKQDFSLLADNIRKLMEGGKVDLHLDLIAGLPYETFDRFRQSFNEVFALGAKEVQLGFLKMLRGTSLRKRAADYNYKYQEEAPYQIESNASISKQELERIHQVEHILEKYWNSGKFANTLDVLFDTHYKGRYFEFFDEFSSFCRAEDFSFRGYQLEDLFRYLHSFLLSRDISLIDFLRFDYYNNYTRRPGGFLPDEIGKKKRKQLLYQIGNDKPFLKKYDLTRKIIEKQTAIDYIAEEHYLLTVFLHRENGDVRLSIPYQVDII